MHVGVGIGGAANLNLVLQCRFGNTQLDVTGQR